MKSLNTKMVLSALGIVAMLTSPAFAKKPHQAAQETASYNSIPGYNKDGGIVGVPNPDQSSTESQR